MAEFAYYKRYRMEASLRQPVAPPELPPGFRFVAWRDASIDRHAAALHEAFAGEIDAELFECFGRLEGCRSLVADIAAKPGFLPEASWLVEWTGGQAGPQPCGTIQGVRVSPSCGSVQNVGVSPRFRCRGIGAALVRAAAVGFRAAWLDRALLEVTAENVSALRLYQSLGFRRSRTTYKSVELATA